MIMSSKPSLAASALSTGLLAGFLVACQTTEAERSVSDLFAAGDYEEALALARTNAEAAPSDPYHDSVERMAEVGLLLDEARDLTLGGDHSAALGVLFEADALSPGHPVVQSWIGKVVRELTDKTLAMASQASIEGDYERAVELYERALVFAPGEERARAGIARSLLLINYRAGMSEQYYTEGVRSLREYWLGRANTEFAASGKYAPGDARGEMRRDQVAGLLAEDRVMMAENLAERGLYHAARNEYRIALLFDGDNEFAARGLKRMDREVAAFAKLGEAERARLRGDFDEAQEAILEGEELSVVQDVAFDSARIDLDEARWVELYREALDAEADGRYKVAVKTFDLLLQETGFYEDALQRRDTLLDMIALADRLYEEFQAAKKAQVKRQKLEQIAVFWPEYKNVSDLLERTP